MCNFSVSQILFYKYFSWEMKCRKVGIGYLTCQGRSSTRKGRCYDRQAGLSIEARRRSAMPSTTHADVTAGGPCLPPPMPMLRQTGRPYHSKGRAFHHSCRCYGRQVVPSPTLADVTAGKPCLPPLMPMLRQTGRPYHSKGRLAYRSAAKAGLPTVAQQR